MKHILAVIAGAVTHVLAAAGRGRALAVIGVLLAGCDPDPDGSGVPPDASVVVDTFVPQPKDAPFMCVPIAPAHGPPPVCLALAPADLRGTTPFGNLDVALEYFGAGDCITISSATITWRGACGELLRVQFPYPVESTSAGRRVITSFDTDARFEFDPPDAAPREDVTMIHVEVVRWQEGQGTHDIDITVSVTDPAYTIAPLHVVGTFCDWAYLLC
ncbi:MAG TPA: hypothetical protein VIV11_41175 [Kofleriaceae bacterium]